MLPTPPEKPSPHPASRTQFAISLLLIFIIASFFAAVLSVLTLGFVGVVVGVFLLMVAFIASQYLLWGWWLGAAIERADEKPDE